jgi:DNA repair protein RAD7
VKAEEYNSDNLDEEAEEDSKPAKKRKLTKRQEVRLKAAEKKKLKRKGGLDSDDEDEDEYTALSRGAERNKQRAAALDAKPPVGNFEECAKCEKRFTVVRLSTICHTHEWDWFI